MSWQGIRVTLGCGHMELRGIPEGTEEKRRWVIGSLAACWVCPKRGGSAAVRQVVNIEPVTAPRAPDAIEYQHWFWEGDGE